MSRKSRFKPKLYLPHPWEPIPLRDGPERVRIPGPPEHPSRPFAILRPLLWELMAQTWMANAGDADDSAGGRP